jgi:hypothetical protein
MTCTRATAIIDAGEFADCPRAEIDAAMRHARQCGACGEALAAAATLAAGLRTLPRPEPPADLPAVVLARIARTDAARPAPSAVRSAAGTAASGARDWSAWIATALGATLVIAMMTLGDALRIEPAMPRLRAVAGGLAAMPSTTAGVSALVAVLVLYTAILFLPIRERRRR